MGVLGNNVLLHVTFMKKFVVAIAAGKRRFLPTFVSHVSKQRLFPFIVLQAVLAVISFI